MREVPVYCGLVPNGRASNIRIGTAAGVPLSTGHVCRRVATNTGVIEVRIDSVTGTATFAFEPVPTELTLCELFPLLNKPVEDRFWAIETTQKKRRAQWKQDPLLRLRNKPRGRA